ncbi:MAG: hypothetical protein IPK59_19565 [Rhodospirillaceae bacterium]|nr:hypothetical protein [Rhodospirillaceae bacterium]
MKAWSKGKIRHNAFWRIEGRQLMTRAPIQTARFRLEGPRDLLRKLSLDIGRMRQSKTLEQAEFAAFDCAVTAWSLVDWCVSCAPALDKTSRTEEMLLRIPGLDVCQTIATGAKHFVVSNQVSPDVFSSGYTLHSELMSDAIPGETIKSAEHFPYIVRLEHSSASSASSDCATLFEEVAAAAAKYLDDAGL